MPYHSSVAMAKGAIEGLTKALAAELAPFIRVNCVAPSLTNTPIAEKFINTRKIGGVAKTQSAQENWQCKRHSQRNRIFIK